MVSSVTVYKYGIKLGTGSVADGSPSITGWVPDAGLPPIFRRNVQVLVTQAGANVSKTFNTRILADDGAGTLTMADKCPCVGA